MIAVVYVAHVRFALNPILAFWIAYVLTRPLGASIGDYLSQPKDDGGLGLGTTVTSVVFLLTILGDRRVPHGHPTRPDRVDDRAVRPCATRPRAHPRRRQQDDRDARAVEAVRERAATGPAEFVMLVPNPAHLAFDRASADTDEGERLLEDVVAGPDTRGRNRHRGPRRR